MLSSSPISALSLSSAASGGIAVIPSAASGFTTLLSHVAVISRLTEDSGENTSTYQQVVASQACMLQPQSEEETVLQGLAVGKTFKCYMDLNANVEESDQVIIDTEEFRVNGIKRYNFGHFPHLRLTLVREQ